MANFGQSFQPGTQDERVGNGANGQPRDRRQEAIKMLSLRLPNRYGAGAITQPGLANAPGGMGAPGARPGATAQAFAMLAGIPFAPVSAPVIPSADQDRLGGVSRAMPQPMPRDPMGEIRDMPAAPAPWPMPSIRPGQETGEGPLQGGGPDDMIRGYVDRPAPPSDPYEELRFLLGLGRDNYNLR